MTGHAPPAPLDQIEWRVQGRIDRGGGVQVVAYVNATTVATLLDEWVGPFNWSDTYEHDPASKGLWCSLSLRKDGDWVTKRDLGMPSDMESEKGLVSDAFKRCATIKWGVARNVYGLPVLRITQFHKAERSGRDPMAYLTEASEREIRDLLRRKGFHDLAEASKVKGGDAPSTPAPGAPTNSKSTTTRGSQENSSSPGGAATADAAGSATAEPTDAQVEAMQRGFHALCGQHGLDYEAEVRPWLVFSDSFGAGLSELPKERKVALFRQAQARPEAFAEAVRAFIDNPQEAKP